MNEHTEKHLKAAIRTMREFCDNAERNMESFNISRHEACSDVLNALSWGFANACSSIQTAINGIGRDVDKFIHEESHGEKEVPE